MKQRTVWISGLITAGAVIAGSIYCLTAQNSDSYSLPARFCSVATDAKAFAPLLPTGEAIEEDSDPLTVLQERDALGNTEDAYCRLAVDKRLSVDVVIRASERERDIHPEDYETALAKLDSARESTNPSFPGRAVVGSHEAFVRATCARRFHSLVVDLEITGPPGNSESQQRMQRWVDDFIPKIMDKTGCTS